MSGAQDEQGGRHAAPEPKEGATKAAEGLSQFLAKLFDQLSLSAWMPAIMLVGNLTILFQLNSQGNLDFGAAVNKLVGGSLGLLILVVFGVVLATILVQAFQFETIRLLEGYWGPSILSTLISRQKTRRHAKRHDRLLRRRQRQVKKVASLARTTMLDRSADMDDIIALQQILNSELNEIAMARKLDDLDGEILWSRHSPPAEMRRLEALERSIKLFPEYSRILPTRLGNSLRVHEDKLRKLDGDLEGYILRKQEFIPILMKTQHDQFRTRLDMYCSLVAIFAILAIISFALVPTISSLPHFATRAAASTIYLTLATTCYLAAISSARGYGQILLLINRAVRKAEDAQVSQP